jgi:hypothetical protein
LRERNARGRFGSLKPGELIAGSHPLDCPFRKGTDRKMPLNRFSAADA